MGPLVHPQGQSASHLAAKAVVNATAGQHSQTCSEKQKGTTGLNDKIRARRRVDKPSGDSGLNRYSSPERFDADVLDK